MIKITDKTKCCGCTACESVCVECGACERVCPIINKKAQKDEITASYIIRTKNDEQLMRCTSGGFSLPLAEIFFENGKVYNGSVRVDYMLKSFFSEISSRPSCYSCAFKTVDRVSDFTVYDCWHAGELCSDIKDDDKGYTNLIVHTKKGARVLDRLSEKCNIYPVDTKRAIAADGVMVCNSATPHPKRRDYYVGLDNATIEQQVQKFIPVTKKTI